MSKNWAMFSKKKKEDPKKTLEGTSRTITTHTRTVTYTSYSQSQSFSQTASPTTSGTIPRSTVFTDAKPINLNYQSPYGNSAVRRSYHGVSANPGVASRPNSTSSYTPISTRGSTGSAGAPRSYYSPKQNVVAPPWEKTVGYKPPATPYSNSSPRPSHTSSLPIISSPSNLEFVVKKTGQIFSSNSWTRVPTYDTHSKHRGEVLLINNILFKDNRAYRTGAEQDHVKLNSLFSQMGFKVELKKNLKKSEIESELSRFSRKKELKTADIAIVVIMSHGTEQTYGDTEIVGADEKLIKVQDILEYFTNRNCKQMSGKPKIFIFQCCRGDNGYVPQTDAVKVKSPCLDTLLAYSTLPGFVSYRDAEKGTYYIQTLCEVFSQNAHNQHVEDLLKMVDEDIKKKQQNPQTTTYINNGFKRCYLHPI